MTEKTYAVRIVNNIEMCLVDTIRILATSKKRARKLVRCEPYNYRAPKYGIGRVSEVKDG